MTVVARLVRSGLLTLPIVALFAAGGFASIWYLPTTATAVWTVTWPLVVGLGCAAAGYAVTERNTAAGHLLALAAVALFAVPLALADGWPRLSYGLWTCAVLVAIPLALLRVVRTRPATRATRPWRLEALVAVSGLTAAAAIATGWWMAAMTVGTASGLIVIGAGARLFELTSGEDRRRLLWVILGVALAAATSLLLVLLTWHAPAATLVFALVAAVLSLSAPAAAAIALIQPRIIDVRAAIEWTTVLALMCALTAALYVGTETTIQAVTGNLPPRGVRVLAVLGVAVAFHPMMRWVRTTVDEMLFGERAGPLDTLNRLGTHLAAGSSPREWLDTLRAALAVPGLVLRQGDETVASSGQIGDTVTVVTQLRAGAEHVGDLVVALPADHRRLAPAMSAILDLVSVPLAQALHAARLAEELRASRGHAVSALEEERRRVRGDLHDGLGPTLTGIAYSADAAANLLRSAPDEALEILHELRGEAGEAIAEIRRIVYGLRPRALDELGLVGALRQQLSHLRTADGRVLTVAIDAPPQLPDLPAAVEVAAYRTTVEAVTNVARHSGVAEATVTIVLTAGPVMHIEVRDRGRSTTAWTPGVGIRSMRERVEQIGGALSVRGGPDGATISAEIPIPVGAPINPQ